MKKELVKIYLCMDCAKPISYESAMRGGGRCHSCEDKRRHIGQLRTIYLCENCAVPISYKSTFYGSGLCKRCYDEVHLPIIYICKNCTNVIDYRTAFKKGLCRSCANKGENNPGYGKYLSLNPNWRNGVSFEPYPLGWNNTFKEQIRFRDGYKCVVCGCPEVENGRKLDVHHEDYDKNNLSPENLSSLCQSCHGKTNGNRKFWIAFLSKLRSNV